MSTQKVEFGAETHSAPPLQVSREEALRGLKDEKGRPLDKAHLAPASESDRTLAEEFIRFLGSPAVQKALDERGKTNDKKSEPQQAAGSANKHGKTDACERHEQADSNLRALMRGLMDLVSGKKDTDDCGAKNTKAVEHKNKKTDHCHEEKKKVDGKHETHAGTPKVPTPAPSAGGSTGKSGPGNALSSSAPPAVKKFEAAIEHASKVTGLEANLIAAMIWAESRGNPNEKSRNIDGHSDVGLMQISQHTYDAYVKGVNRNLPALNVNDPSQNILAGALEMAQKLKDKGGNLHAALNAYVGEGINDKYVPNVMHFYGEMKHGRTPSDSDYV